MAQYAKKSRKRKKKRNGLPVLIPVVAGCLVVTGTVAAFITVGQAKAAEEETAQQRLIAAETVAAEQTLIADMQAESLTTARANAGFLAQSYREQAEEGQAGGSPTGTTGTTGTTATAGTGQQSTTQTTVAPTGEFNAAAYTGTSGAENIPYYRSINSDVVGWLKVPGTNINYAVVHADDVNYYTSRGYDKPYSYYGVIWTNPGSAGGATADTLPPNTVLYGHNWTNYSATPRIGNANDIMFAQLTGYHYLSTAQSYPYFYYSTNEGQFVVKIFACFYTELAFQYNQPYLDVSATAAEAKARSRHTFDVDVNSSDKLVTLSTCTRAYGQTSNQRFVVMGRLLRPGETIEPVTVTANPNHKQPSVW